MCLSYEPFYEDGVSIEDDLELIKTEATSSETFPCARCNFIGGSFEDIKNHIESSHEESKTPKEKCDAETEESKNERFSCAPCNFLGNSLEETKKHTESSHNEIPGEEGDASNKEGGSKALEHVNPDLTKKLSESKELLKCEKCPFTGHTTKEMKKHTKVHDAEHNHACHYCSYLGMVSSLN